MEEFVFFWGGYLSNWYISTFYVDKVEYNCVEQYMMAEKAKLFGDEATLRQIMRTPHPQAQKALGRKVRGYRDSVWTNVRVLVVLRGVMAKFRYNEELEDKLVRTGDKTIVEASPEDCVWGIGLGMRNPDRLDRAKWRGENLLGTVLMEARRELKRERSLVDG